MDHQGFASRKSSAQFPEGKHPGPLYFTHFGTGSSKMTWPLLEEKTVTLCPWVRNAATALTCPVEPAVRGSPLSARPLPVTSSPAFLLLDPPVRPGSRTRHASALVIRGHAGRLLQILFTLLAQQSLSRSSTFPSSQPQTGLGALGVRGTCV